jgi:hypothetical protein
MQNNDLEIFAQIERCEHQKIDIRQEGHPAV